MTELVLTLLALTAVAPALTLLLRRRWVDPTVPVAGVILLLLAVAALLAAVTDDVTGWQRGAAATLAVAAATTGGSDVVRAFFRAMRHEFDPRRDHPVPGREGTRPPDAAPPRRSSESVLRGGVWIGYLERAAIAATLLAGWPEGVALVLAVKGVGRYPELRGSSGSETDASEAFIIGTLVSVLWAAAAAGTARLVG